MNVLIHGALITLKINGKVYNEAQSVSLTVDYNETPIFGIDSIYPQEIYTNKVVVSGSVQGLRVSNSGGLQAYNMRPLFTENSSSPYISIEILDRKSGEHIVFIPQAKVSQESHSMATKTSYKLSFNFVGIQPLFALDRT